MSEMSYNKPNETLENYILDMHRNRSRDRRCREYREKSKRESGNEHSPGSGGMSRLERCKRLVGFLYKRHGTGKRNTP